MMKIRFPFVLLVALGILAARANISFAAERTKTGVVVSVDPRDQSFHLKYRERLEDVEKRFEARNVANFADIKKGAKLTVTFNDETFLVSRVFSFGPANADAAGDAADKKDAPSASRNDDDIIGSCRTAKEVVIAYEAALRSLTLDAAERERMQGELLKWRTAASQNLQRVGSEWIPAEKAAELRNRAETLIEQAIELLLVDNDRLAMKILAEAAALDPDSNRAGFLAGWVSVHCDDDATASKYFRECAKRTPNNVAVLNNLAVVEVRTKKFKEAVDHWVQAARLDPKNPGVAQNLGRFVSLANARAFGSAPAKSIDDASRAYIQMISLDPDLRADPEEPWAFYLPPSLAKSKSGGNDAFGESGAMIGHGSGFVVAPGYVLTNRHVAEDAKGFYILDPKNAKVRYPAEVVAVIAEPGPDLAILRCPGLVAPALPIRGSELPRVASEVMATGFPQATELGTQAKSTVGRIIALPDPQLEGVLLYDAGTDGGNSGGPICDHYGDVVAVHAVGFKFKIDANGGVPIGEAIAFLKKNVPGFELATGRRTTKDWPDVAEAQRRSTVLICILDEPVNVPKVELARSDSNPNLVAERKPTTSKPALSSPAGAKPIAAASVKSKVIHRLDADGKNANVERIVPENRRDFFTDAEIEAAIAGEGYRWAK